MSGKDILGYTHIAENQSGKHIASNDIDDRIAEATNDADTIAVAGHTTLTVAQLAAAHYFELTDNGVVAAFNLRLPAQPRNFIVENNTGHQATVGVDPGEDGFDGTTVVIEDGEIAVLMSTGTDVKAVGGNVSGAPAGGDAGTIYDLPFSWKGAIEIGVIGRLVAGRDVRIDGAASPFAYGDAGTNPAATAELLLKVEGVTVATVSISTGGAFTFADVASPPGNIDIDKGETATLEYDGAGSPPTADASLADIAVTFQARVR